MRRNSNRVAECTADCAAMLLLRHLGVLWRGSRTRELPQRNPPMRNQAQEPAFSGRTKRRLCSLLSVISGCSPSSRRGAQRAAAPC
eukprot:1095281-Rhodomonas_salina.1